MIKYLPIGFRYMLLSALGFSCMAACVKAVSSYQIPLLEIVLVRALVSLLISYIDVKRKGIPMFGNRKLLLLARAIIGAFALICIYYTLTTIPLAEATFLQYLYPVFTAFLAVLFLKERLQRSTYICLICSIAGLVLMLKQGLQPNLFLSLPTLSIVTALLGSFGSACAYILVRKLSASEENSVIILYFPLVTVPIAAILLGSNVVIPPPTAAILLILVGIFTQIGQVGLTKAMRVTAANKATAYSYVQIIFSLVIGWLYFGEIPSFWTYIGGGLIIIGALINIYGSSAVKKLMRWQSV